MTTAQPAHLDRRTLIARSARIAALATLAHRLPAAAQSSPEAGDDDFTSLVSGNTAFALDLYHQLREEAPGNLLVSPLSISLALAMTWAGARGDTAAQMAETLGLPDAGDSVHAAFGALADDLLTRGNIKTDPERGGGENGLRIANALWGEQTFPFNAAFIDGLEAAYGAGLQQTDFIHAPDAARDEINAWVEEQTENHIQDIVPPGAITALTRLVLANAIYFYGSWQHDFDPMATNDEPFHLLDGETVDVPFMYQEREFAYADVDGVQLISLPYAGAGLNMTIVLPDEGDFDAFEESLDPATLQAAIDGFSMTPLYLWMPTFEFEFATGLVPALQALGMTDAFNPDRADFTGMLDEGADPDEGLVISDVLHKAFIAVDEKGTEAAAATVVIMAPTSAQPEDKPRPIEVRVDRPFLFAIRDSQTGTILFLGRVTDPR